MFSQPSTPSPPPPPAPPPEAPKATDEGMKIARNDERKKAAAMMGAGATIQTSGKGDLTPVTLGTKTLLGQ
jgi:hypothetical protein